MEKIYIDEQYDHENQITYFSILRIDEINKKILYSKLRDVILKREKNRKNITFLLTELKLHKVKHKPYFEQIIKILSEVMSHEIEMINSNKNDKTFIYKCAALLCKIHQKNKVPIVIDKIDNNAFTNKILSLAANAHVIVVDSHDEKGIQLADLLLYKLTKSN